MLWAAYVARAGRAWSWPGRLTCLAVVLWRGAGRLDGAGARRRSAASSSPTYPTFLVGFAALLLAPEDGVGRMFVFLITTVCSDVGGYAAGVLFGKHPMAPTISPKKSWEGFAGSVASAWSVARSRPLLARPLVGRARARVGVAVAATVGDLMESLIKRDLGIKDMSNDPPGARRRHGPPRLARRRRADRLGRADPAVGQPVLSRAVGRQPETMAGSHD